ncbi:MAG TPA: MFS transporter [Dongiaceae bacterium]|nr:MFS transporter [Dongiaceae bacterium]
MDHRSDSACSEEMRDTTANTESVSADVNMLEHTVADERSEQPAQTSRAARRGSLGWTLAATSLGLIVVMIDITIVNVALPHIGAQLGAAVGGLQWVIDAYTLAFAGLLLSAGVIGDRLGSRGTYVLGIILFGLASLGCGIAPDTLTLIVARVVQGASAAMIMPTSLALIAHACGDDHRMRTRAIGWWSSTGGAAVAAGPLIGGFLIDAFGWRSIFLVNLPLCALALWMVWRYVAESTTHKHGTFDWLGQILAIVTLTSLTGAVIEAGSRGWSDPFVIKAFGAAFIGGLIFLIIERRHPHPMLPLGFFRRSTFSAASCVGVVINVTFYGLIFVLSLYFQEVRHYTPGETGLAFLPLTGIFVLSNIASGWLATRLGFRLPITGGLIVGAAGFALLYDVSATTPFLYMAIALALIPIGTGVTVPAMTASVLASIERQRAGTASAVLNTARQVGGAMGVALFGGLIARSDVTSGLQDVFRLSTGMLLLAAIVSWLWIKARPQHDLDMSAAAGGH